MPPQPSDYEKLGAFYLGRVRDLRPADAGQPIPAAPDAAAAAAAPDAAAGPALAAASAPATHPEASGDDLLMLDSRDLTTHAICVGMTGSGKTGLCISLLEEAAIDGVPAIAIDPKGDLGNLMLTFPDLAASDFRPWIDEGEAERAGVTIDAHAEAVAGTWRNGLAAWGQDGARIRRLRQAADIRLWTPGLSSARPLSLLRSFSAPPPGLAADADAVRERVLSSAAGLLALAGVQGDPLRGREHVLVATILDGAWREGRSLDLAGIIAEITKPRFTSIGVVDLESFYPARERFELAMALNALAASPGFAAWLEGEPLDVGSLLHAPDGRPRVSILCIAHLSDAERMFFVTMLLQEVVAWMRRQPGTGSLRALLFMDEVFGFLPPVANPPSKQPMLTLLKQARAHGLGVVLATQNPVDLDYKALSNAGTWFLGRLQTERDKLRVLDGLQGAAATAGAGFDRASMDALLSGLGKRMFVLGSAHEDAPVVFETRWAMSYLRGPLTRPQIQALAREGGGAGVGQPAAAGTAAGTDAATDVATDAGAATGTAAGTGNVVTPGALSSAPGAASPSGGASSAPGTSLPSGGDASAPSPSSASSPAASTSPATTTSAPSTTFTLGGARPLLPPGVTQTFLSSGRAASEDAAPTLHPGLLAQARLHHVAARDDVDAWRDVMLLLPVPTEGLLPAWGEAIPLESPILSDEPPQGALFGALPSPVTASAVTSWKKSLAQYLASEAPLVLLRCDALRATSRPGESEREFRGRLAHEARERRDADVDALRERHAPRLHRLQERLRKAEQKVEVQRGQQAHHRHGAMLSAGGALLGALFGRRGSALGRATTAARGFGRASQEGQDVARAEADVHAAQADIAKLEEDLAAEIQEITAALDPVTLVLDELRVPARRADTTIAMSLCWSAGR